MKKLILTAMLLAGVSSFAQETKKEIKSKTQTTTTTPEMKKEENMETRTLDTQADPQAPKAASPKADKTNPNQQPEAADPKKKEKPTSTN